jgi:integrase
MAKRQPHLESRPTGYYWRRRVPAREARRFESAFFCFPLHTPLIREAADVARRITAISDLCFYSETDLPPELMTQILTDYARLEIETADRLRALTGPRTRAAADAALALETAARASLRDAIYLCDRSPAKSPIRDMADRLGVALDEEEDDFAILTDKMMRLLIEVSLEKEQRARGIFREPQHYISAALTTDAPVAAEKLHSAPSSTAASAPDTPTPHQLIEKQVSVASEELIQEPDTTTETVFHEDADMKITVKAGEGTSALGIDGGDPRLVDLWDSWFTDNCNGVQVSGAYTFTDEGNAARFRKESDTIQSTRKLIVTVFGEKRMSQITDQDWVGFNDMLRALPNNHGRSSKLRHLNCFEFTKRARDAEQDATKAAERQIKKERLSGDERDEILRKARYNRISPTTFQRHQKNLSAPLNHAVERRMISQNPFKPFVLGEKAICQLRKGQPDTSRLLWTSVDVACLLGTEMWNSEKTKIDDPIFWVPLIALLHGMRSEEILQLKPRNICCDQGIFYFVIERGTGQSTKSNNSKRLIPIHSQLIELGFLELVDRQKKLGKLRIFDTVSRSKSSKSTYAQNFGKKFTYYRKSRGAYETSKDLHAMRTTFNTRLVTEATPDTARRYLMGHDNPDVGITNYLPEGFSLKTLSRYIEEHRIDLSVVTRRFANETLPNTGPRLAVKDGIALSA